METDKWDIMPYARAGVLVFGMSQDEVRSMLGEESLKDFDKDTNETILYWQDNSLQLVFDGKGLSMVSFYPTIENIFIENAPMNWNDTATTFKWLLENDPSAMTDVGIFVFFKYGVSVSGLDSDENSDKSITAFREGVWSRDDSLLRPVGRGDIFTI